MNKFSKLKKGQLKEQEKEEKSLFKGNFIEVLEYRGYEMVKEKDMVIILPYLKDEASIILRHEYVPTYQYHYKDDTNFKSVENFLTIISGSVEDGETLENAIRRELYEEAGVVLSNLYEIEIDKHLFTSKGNVARYHTCILELNYNDFKLTTAPGDGTEHERKSKSIKIGLGDIDEIRTHDLITEYMVTKLKLENKI